MASETRLVAVPESADFVDYTTLVVVDPGTLTPVQQPNVPIWYAYVDGVEAEAAASATSSEASRVAAEAAQTAATGSQTSASASASAAAGSATAAATSATNAATSATTAQGHATTAQGHSNNASTYATQAATSKDAAAASATTATTQANAANAAATAADVSKTSAQAARDTAVSYATGFGIGIVTSTPHTSEATAAIGGNAPNLKLDLGIPRGVPTAITIGEVETGPETPGIVGPQGPTGPKGDPGGFANFASIGNVNLDTMVTNGIYKQTNGSYTNTANNYPVNGGIGTLSVQNAFDDTSRLEQTFHRITASPFTMTSRAFWKRTKYDTSGWSPWYSYTSSRVDQTAGRVIYQWDDLNSREQIIWGDTGWRDIKGLTINGWTSTSLLIRRVGSSVSLVGNITATAATSDHYLPIQAGFAPFAGNYHGVASSTAVPPLFRPLGTDAVNHYVTSGGFSGTYNLQANYMTVSPWPTALPGTASGSIPNL
jgi:hypothetical protein